MAKDRDLKDYLHRILVRPGFRPQAEVDIEKALDAFDEGPMDSDAVARILGKAKGEIRLSYESEDIAVERIEQTVESEELLALHKSEGDEESEEVRKKLEEYRQQAKDEGDSENELENDDD